MPLLAASYFAHLFTDLRGKFIGFVPLAGNAGDLMIQRASRELFKAFDIEYRQISNTELDSKRLVSPVDEIVVSGGGNMGTLWKVPYIQRRKALELGVPVSIFPQSFTRNDEEINCYKKVFVRELASKAYNEHFILAPEMALGMVIPGHYAPPRVEIGLFLRKDQESCLDHNPVALVDPVQVSRTIDEYLQLASLFEHIITDRLHFAIAGLMLKRKVTLLPNAYHKNLALYEAWLRDLGCYWANNSDHIVYDKDQLESLLWKRLGGIPSEIIDWRVKPSTAAAYQSQMPVDAGEYFSMRETYGQVDLSEPGILYSLCNGKNSIEEMVTLISSYYPERRVSIALDLQSALRSSRYIRLTE